MMEQVSLFSALLSPYFVTGYKSNYFGSQAGLPLS